MADCIFCLQGGLIVLAYIQEALCCQLIVPFNRLGVSCIGSFCWLRLWKAEQEA